MEYPFKIETTFNKQMRCHELLIIIGGITSKEELDEFSESLAKFISNNKNYARVKHDA